MSDHLIVPHGGKLVNLLADPEHAKELRRSSRNWVSWELSERQRCDLELLLSGAYSPLRGFMSRKDYESVCGRMRLYSDLFWPIPVVLDVPEEFAQTLETGQPMALRDSEGELLAYIDVEEKWKPDRFAEADQVYGTTDPQHPGVHALLESTHPWYVGGPGGRHPTPRPRRLPGAAPHPAGAAPPLPAPRLAEGGRPAHHGPAAPRPARAGPPGDARDRGQPADPPGGGRRRGGRPGATSAGCGATRRWPPATPPAPRRCPSCPWWSGAPAPGRPSGRRSSGATTAAATSSWAPTRPGRGATATGCPYYAEYEAQELVMSHAADLGITPVPARRMLYVEELESWIPADEVPTVRHGLELPEAEALRRLSEGRGLPRWFTFPEVEKELVRQHPPRSRQGFTVCFTGLPGSGKSTLARALRVRLQESGGRAVSYLDGAGGRPAGGRGSGGQGRRRGRRPRPPGLDGRPGDPRRRRGHPRPGRPPCRSPPGGAAAGRGPRRLPAGPRVHASGRLRGARPQGAVRKARAGQIHGFIGVSEPYEPPQDADLVIDTTDLSPQEAVQRIILRLQREGYLRRGIAARSGQQPLAGLKSVIHTICCLIIPRTGGPDADFPVAAFPDLAAPGTSRHAAARRRPRWPRRSAGSSGSASLGR